MRKRKHEQAYGSSAECLVLHRHRVVEPEPAAVGVDRLPGEVTRIGARQEDGNTCDLVGFADRAGAAA